MLKRLRLLHLSLGLFLAPTILFFSFSGMLQVFHKHEARPGDTQQAPRWIATMAQVHKNQHTVVRERPLRPRTGPAPHENLALKTFFGLAALGIIALTLIGIWMAFAIRRDRGLIWTLLIAGTVVPVVLLYVG